MIFYEKLAQLMEANRAKLAQTTALEARQTAEFGRYSQSQIEEWITNHVTHFAAYVRDGNIQKWQEYLQGLTATSGLTAIELLNLGNIFFPQLLQLIEQETSGPDQANLRQRYQERLEAVRMVIRTSLVANSLTNKK